MLRTDLVFSFIPVVSSFHLICKKALIRSAFECCGHVRGGTSISGVPKSVSWLIGNRFLTRLLSHRRAVASTDTVLDLVWEASHPYQVSVNECLTSDLISVFPRLLDCRAPCFYLPANFWLCFSVCTIIYFA